MSTIIQPPLLRVIVVQRTCCWCDRHFEWLIFITYLWILWNCCYSQSMCCHLIKWSFKNARQWLVTVISIYANSSYPI